MERLVFEIHTTNQNAAEEFRASENRVGDHYMSRLNLLLRGGGFSGVLPELRLSARCEWKNARLR